MSRSFTWMTDQTPEWFSANNSYRFNPDTKQIELPTTKGNEIVDPGDIITLHEDGHFSVFRPDSNHPDVEVKAEDKQRKILKRVFVEFDDGTQAEMKIDTIMIVDRQTNKPLFDEVMEQK